MDVLHITIVDEKNINDYVLKSSIFFKDNVLLITGRSPRKRECE